MSTSEAILITIVAFFLAALICVFLFGGNTDSPLLVPIFLVIWFLVGYILAEATNRRRKK